MFIECYKNNGIPYLRLVRSVRRPSKVTLKRLHPTNTQNFPSAPFPGLMTENRIM